MPKSLTLTSSVKVLVRKLLRSAGYEVTRSSSAFSDMQRRLLARCDLVADVGANTGQYADLVRSLGFRGSVVSFEPQLAAANVLRARADRTPGWDVRPVALGSEPGTATLRVSRNSVSSSLLDIREEHVRAAPRSSVIAREEVTVSTLDDELAAVPGRAVWLKLDVQGAELPILEGGAATLDRTLAVQSEMSLQPLYDGQTDYLDLCAHLRRNGFVLCHLTPGFTDPTSAALLQIDGLFARM
jgi:FkbM family methyltransferase